MDSVLPFAYQSRFNYYTFKKRYIIFFLFPSFPIDIRKHPGVVEYTRRMLSGLSVLFLYYLFIFFFKLCMGHFGAEIIVCHFSMLPQMIYTRPKTLGTDL